MCLLENEEARFVYSIERDHKCRNQNQRSCLSQTMPSLSTLQSAKHLRITTSSPFYARLFIPQLTPITHTSPFQTNKAELYLLEQFLELILGVSNVGKHIGVFDVRIIVTKIVLQKVLHRLNVLLVFKRLVRIINTFFDSISQF